MNQILKIILLSLESFGKVIRMSQALSENDDNSYGRVSLALRSKKKTRKYFPLYTQNSLKQKYNLFIHFCPS